VPASSVVRGRAAKATVEKRNVEKMRTINIKPLVIAIMTNFLLPIAIKKRVQTPDGTTEVAVFTLWFRNPSGICTLCLILVLSLMNTFLNFVLPYNKKNKTIY
jgi:hypothetical protein